MEQVKKKNHFCCKGKLTGKMIDKLTVYYGLAIRRNFDSIEGMYNAIWATYYHHSSTDSNPCHDKCLPSEDSWCSWQCASAKRELASFKDNYVPLPQDVLSAIKFIYEDLNKHSSLKKCVGGFAQNNNESFN